MIGQLITQASRFVGEHFGALICLGLGLSVLCMFFCLALVRGGSGK